VNLIGGQVDYHEGIVVAMAVDRDVWVAARPASASRVRVTSLDLDGTVDVAADGSTDPAAIEPVWGRAVGGVVRTLAERGRPPAGADLAVASTVPIGGGLSSSAAFEVAVALALCDAAGWTLPPLDLARAAQEAEHRALGVPCGIQDQLTAVAAHADAALVIDCRSLAIEHLPLPPAVGVLVVHSGVPRTLAGSLWTARRQESFAVARALGLRVLRDATPAQVASEPRGRHVVSEIERAHAFAAALRRGAVDELGPLLRASHRSSRDDMQVSIPELDALVDCLEEAGALGARLTGGGFGGCVVALVPAEAVTDVARAATDAYERRTGRHPTAWPVRAGAGAGPLDP
jgi:galactokinase